MYINVNMCNLENFDPSSAVEYWMRQSNRKPKSSAKRKESEWFYGVFDDCLSGRKRIVRPKTEF